MKWKEMSNNNPDFSLDRRFEKSTFFFKKRVRIVKYHGDEIPYVMETTLLKEKFNPFSMDELTFYYKSPRIANFFLKLGIKGFSSEKGLLNHKSRYIDYKYTEKRISEEEFYKLYNIQK